MTQTLTRQSRRDVLWLVLVIVGIGFRIAIVVLPGNELRAPWSGGGDAPHYVLLAQNLLNGNGFTYALQPTALRAPAYTWLLAALMWTFGGEFILAVRWIQFVLGLATAYLCGRTSAHLFGENAARPTFAIALLFPTLLFITGEVLTEAVAAFLGAVFFYFAVQAMRKPGVLLFTVLGVVTSVAALFRFNMALLGIVAIWVALAAKNSRPAWQRVLLVCAAAGLVIFPWVIRNEIAFHGQVLYSTLSGTDAVEGVLAPQGRALPGDVERIRSAEGWVHNDIETNAPSRLSFPSEAVLNRHAWNVAEGLWKRYGWRLIPLEIAKCSYFWLSTDQILWTQSFSFRQRILRWSGVLAYWILLALGVAGWLLVRRENPMLARCFVFYAILVTALHLPFPMSTRLRIPLVDPVFATLAGPPLRVMGERRRRAY